MLDNGLLILIFLIALILVGYSVSRNKVSPAPEPPSVIEGSGDGPFPEFDEIPELMEDNIAQPDDGMDDE